MIHWKCMIENEINDENSVLPANDINEDGDVSHEFADDKDIEI